MSRAAAKAFVGMTDFYLQLLIRSLRLLAGVDRADRPKTTIERVVLLIRHVLPDLSANAVWDILQQRLPKVQHGSAIAANMDACDGVIDASDKASVKQAAKDEAELKAARAAMEKLMAPGSRFLEGFEAPAPRAPKPKKAASAKPTVKHLGKVRTGAAATELLPKVTGCFAVRVHSKRTWTVYYKGTPASRSRTWGFHQTESRVLRHCLLWAWKRHEEATAERCPFTFSC